MAHKHDIETLFKSEDYASSFKRGEMVTRTFAELLVDQSKVAAESKANPNRPLVILDNACGTGVVSNALNTQLDGIVKKKCKLTCGDISSAMLAHTAHRLQQEGWENVETKIVDAQKPDLPSNHYSHIFSGFGELCSGHAPTHIDFSNHVSSAAYMALPESIKALDGK